MYSTSPNENEIFHIEI